MTDADTGVMPENRDGCKSVPTKADLEIVAARFCPADFEPIIKKASDSLYETVMQACENYLRENVQWNIGSHIDMLERENQRMRTELFEVDRALGCHSLGQASRLNAIRETQDRMRQAYSKLEAASK